MIISRKKYVPLHAIIRTRLNKEYKKNISTMINGVYTILLLILSNVFMTLEGTEYHTFVKTIIISVLHIRISCVYALKIQS